MNDERYHDTLGIKPGASREELKTAYRDMAKVWHPDRFAHDPQLQRKAQEKLKEINEAYKQLTSPRPLRQRAARRDADSTHAGATHYARSRYHTPPAVVVRQTEARRPVLPLVAVVLIVAAVTFFAASRLFTNKPEASVNASASTPTIAPAESDAAQLSSADAPKDRQSTAPKRASESVAPSGAADAFAAPTRALPTVTRTIDPTTGMLATRSCPTRALMTYPAGSEPQGFCAAAHPAKTSAPRDAATSAQTPRVTDVETAGGTSASSPSETKEKSRLKSVVGTLASPGKWFKKKKEKPPAQP
ncbi:MAG TPA: DnaJ domain-containing protein [Pyrinomonadaceae bacterium]|nr:DnaJ domain-containing protein [Pyrinomonadaceae bacterium]